MQLNETPANYRIWIQGHLGENWGDRLGGMVITKAFTKKNHPITIIVGYLPDQKVMSNILNTLYQMRMPLISLENLDETNE